MRKPPVVTVIMPVFNGERYLRQAIDSILSQTFREFELWIADDNSSDGTGQILQSYKDHPLIRIFRNDVNMGVAATLNKYFELAESKYIARMDADDISLPRRLEKQFRFMEDHPEIGVCGSWISVFGDRKFKIKYPEHHELIRIDLLFACPMAHPTVFIRRSIFKENDIRYRTDCTATEDYELWSGISSIVRFANLKEVLLRYREHGKQEGSRLRNIQALTAGRIRSEQLERLGICPDDEECKIHEAIALGTFERSTRFAAAAEKWFEKLMGANLSSAIYDQKEFSRYLGRKLFKICRKVSGPDRELHSIFSKSPFCASVGISQKLELWLNLIFKRVSQPRLK